MRIDFSKVRDAIEYDPIPDGDYVVEIQDVEETTTKSGEDMFRLTHRVVEGDYAGRWVFDNLPLTEAAWPRLKLVLDAVGVDVGGAVDVVPAILVGRRCRVEVRTESYATKKGKEARRNVVRFRGYSRADEEDLDAYPN